jgi:hypothetical protein
LIERPSALMMMMSSRLFVASVCVSSCRVISPGRSIERPSASIVRTALLVVSPGCLMNGSPL